MGWLRQISFHLQELLDRPRLEQLRSVRSLIRDPRALHKVEVVSGVLEQECAELLTQFFAQKR